MNPTDISNNYTKGCHIGKVHAHKYSLKQVIDNIKNLCLDGTLPEMWIQGYIDSVVDYLEHNS